MKSDKTLLIIIIILFVSVTIVTICGIWSKSGVGSYTYKSIRDQEVNIYGKGIYRHMNTEVAIQGIAQDYITLFIALPLLLISYILSFKRNYTGYYLLSGTLFYLFVTYLIYLCMGMYNEVFLLYTVNVSLSFFSLIRILFILAKEDLEGIFNQVRSIKFAGFFLMINSILIAIMWLGVVIPPLINGEIFPKQLEHYTTLIVQGLDLSLFLPMSFLSGLLLFKKSRLGYLLAPVYLVFLSILMTALSAKITAMGLSGYNIIPAIVIIPLINLTSIVTTWVLLNQSSIKNS